MPEEANVNMKMAEKLVEEDEARMSPQKEQCYMFFFFEFFFL